MKRFKREENAIIIHFIFYFVLTIWLVIFSFSSIFPQIKTIEANKETTNDVYNNIVRIEKSWLTFEEFKKLNWIWGSNRVITEILKSMSEEFYTNSLVNTTFTTYTEFLEDKTKELNSDENKELVEEKSKQISKLLPLYSDNSIDFWGYVLTDYKFVNYVESIVESFNFSTYNSIGISKLSLLKDFAVGNSDWEALDSNMYYVPLKLALKWTKAGVIEFLYFIENVGNISIKEGNIELNKDFWFLSKNSIKKVLEWDKLTKNYNIFEHQIIDIDRITMWDYIDSSYLSRWDSDFKEYIMKTQWKDNFEISVDLMFYVKWQPTYKIEEFITGVLNKHKTTQGLVNVELKKIDLEKIDRINLNKSNDLLKELSKDVLGMRKELAKKEKLEDVYNRAVQLDVLIDPIFKSLKK